jgi:hypothetical protein
MHQFCRPCHTINTTERHMAPNPAASQGPSRPAQKPAQNALSPTAALPNSTIDTPTTSFRLPTTAAQNLPPATHCPRPQACASARPSVGACLTTFPFLPCYAALCFATMRLPLLPACFPLLCCNALSCNVFCCVFFCHAAVCLYSSTDTWHCTTSGSFCRSFLSLFRFLDHICRRVCYKSVTQYYRMLVNTPRLLTCCGYVAMPPYF